MEVSYEARKEQLQTYFDSTANKAWEQLTSDEPVSRIRETVRNGRQAMADCLMEWLPDDMSGLRLLDAGCGTGSLSIQAAERGASVVAIDISPSLIGVAQQRTPEHLAQNIHFKAGDMLSVGSERFDAIVAMDSLIHYQAQDMVASINSLAQSLSDKPGSQLLFTFAPRTPLLMLMKATGKFFPKSDRSPAIEPVAEKRLHRMLDASNNTHHCASLRTQRIDTPFYKSQALELVRQ